MNTDTSPSQSTEADLLEPQTANPEVMAFEQNAPEITPPNINMSESHTGESQARAASRTTPGAAAPLVTQTSSIQTGGASDSDNSSEWSNTTSPEFIYASGKLRPHFPSRGLEKEGQAAAKILDISPRDYYSLFTYKDEQGNPPYRYIAEQVSWILCIDNQDVYVLLPNSGDELNEFINTLNVKEDANLADETLSVAIGVLGPVAPKELSDGKELRMVMCNHLYHFTTEDLLKELAGSNSTTTSIRDVLNALTTKPNTGASDVDRAKNYLAYRYSSVYTKTAVLDSGNETNTGDSQFLKNLETKLSDSSPGRTIVDIIFTYKKTVSGRINSYYTSIDVTDQFPFLHSNLTDYVSTN